MSSLSSTQLRRNSHYSDYKAETPHDINVGLIMKDSQASNEDNPLILSPLYLEEVDLFLKNLDALIIFYQ